MVTLLSAAAPCPLERLQPQAWGVQGSGGAGQGVVGVGKAPRTIPGADKGSTKQKDPLPRTHSTFPQMPDAVLLLQRGHTRMCKHTHTHTCMHAHRHKGNIISGGASKGPSPHQEEVREKPGRSQAGGGEEGCQPFPRLCSVR